jgi:DNA-binding SARP family transcriptional activator/tetratricopeptide (TPR) repeat protein
VSRPDPVTFRLLGPLVVQAGSRPTRIAAHKQRTVLAMLLTHAGHAVPMQSLVDEVWEGCPPRSAAENVRTYVMQLRRLLPPRADLAQDRLVTCSSGYLLRVDTDEFDLLQFEACVKRGRQATAARSLGAAENEFAAALALWRGTMAEDVPLGGTLRTVVARMTEQHLTMAEDHADVLLALGRNTEVVERLRRLVAHNPLRERMYQQLMLALYRCGDVAGALAAFGDARRVLADELGIDPGPELYRLHEAVLRRDAQLMLPGTSTDDADASPGEKPAPLVQHVPALLPLDAYGFTGRTGHLAQLDALLGAASEQPTAMVVCVLSGTAGVGKTTLAVHWAHRVRESFPDGQLYVNLRGFDPSGPPTAPAEAARGFLDALQVPSGQIPATVEARTGLYRSLLAGQRILIVLDNARDAGQVRPLLPGAPGCLVVVTSRNQLTSLLAAEGARPIRVDLLAADEARDLLAHRLGPDRVAAEPTAVDEVIAGCARLPLALAVAAARAAANPGFSLANLAAELREAPDPLDAFDSDDLATQVRTVFSWSYHTLSAGAARLFRLLGLHPGADIGAPAAASLAGVPASRAHPLLAELTGAHLITEHTPGRYTFHDLLRAYAAELVHAVDSTAERCTVTHRILDHYLHTAHTAALLLEPRRDPIRLAPHQLGVAPEELVDPGHALDWFNAEYTTLLAAIPHASATGFDSHTWQLAWTLTTFFNRSGHWEEFVTAQHMALDAARRLADRTGQAHIHRSLGLGYAHLGRLDDAHAHLRQALDLTGELGDHTGQANIHHNLAWVLSQQGFSHCALGHARQALDLYSAAGHRAGEARALNAVGWLHTLLGEHQQALTRCQQALTVLQELGDRPGQANTWDSLGHAHHHLGRHDQATACYQRALDFFQADGDRYHEADVLTHLGDNHHAADDPDSARRTWQQALSILNELGHASATQVHTKLNQLGRPVASHPFGVLGGAQDAEQPLLQHATQSEQPHLPGS